MARVPQTQSETQTQLYGVLNCTGQAMLDETALSTRRSIPTYYLPIHYPIHLPTYPMTDDDQPSSRAAVCRPHVYLMGTLWVPYGYLMGTL